MGNGLTKQSKFLKVAKRSLKNKPKGENMRLLDNILAKGLDISSAYVRTFRADALELLRDSELVVIDNVAEYYFSQHFPDEFTLSDLPCVMLPFENTFMEFRMPEKLREKTGIREVGILMFMEEDVKIFKDNPETMDWPEIKHTLASFYFYHQIGSKKSVLVALSMLPVGAQGQIISPDQKSLKGYHKILVEGINEEEKNRMLQTLNSDITLPTLLGLSFMHCRNVSMKDVEQTDPLAKFSTLSKKKKRPLIRYHVLVIDHMKQILEREGHASTEGFKKALHICRGHFATYGIDGKGLLFGKHAGRVWVPMHARGSVEQGIVTKDYDVK